MSKGWTSERLVSFMMKRMKRRVLRQTLSHAADASILRAHETTINGHEVVSYATSETLMRCDSDTQKKMFRELLAHSERSVSQSQLDSADSASSPTNALDGVQKPYWLSANPDLLAFIRSDQTAIPLSHIALVYLIGEAISGFEGDSEALRAVLSRTDFRIVLKLPFHDLHPDMLAMIASGILSSRLPVDVNERYFHRETKSSFQFRHTKLNTFNVSAPSTGGDLRKTATDAIRSGEACLFVVAGNVEIPDWLHASADAVLELRSIPKELLAKVISVASGEVVQSCLSAISTVNGALEPSLSDLVHAARKGRSASDIVRRLDQLRYSQGGSEEAEESKATTKSSQRTNSSKPIEIIPPPKDAVDGLRHVRVEDLAGYGEAQTWAFDLRNDLQLWQNGGLAWQELSSKLLLFGPPGTGKTSFAKAVAHSLKLPLIMSSVADWLELSFLGDVLRQMSATFDAAVKNAPCLLFIDEIDGIGLRDAEPGRSHDEYWTSLINRLLTLLDGALRTEGVVVIAATNRKSKIDPALLRAGRLEHHIEITRPDIDALENILCFYLKHDLARIFAGVVDQSTGLNQPESKALRSLAAASLGMTGADIESAVKRAKLQARREGRELALSDVEDAITQQRPRNSDEFMWSAAIHEAGHAVVYTALGLASVVEVSISTTGGGQTRVNVDENKQQDEDGLMRRLAALLAGREAEAWFTGRCLAGSGGAPESDLARATALALKLEAQLGYGGDMPLLFRGHLPEPEFLHLAEPALRTRVNNRLENAAGQAKAIIDKNREVIERLANAVTDRFELKGPELDALLAAVKPEESTGWR